MRSFIQRRLGGTEYTARVHGTSQASFAACMQFNPGPRSYGLIDNVSLLLVTYPRSKPPVSPQAIRVNRPWTSSSENEGHNAGDVEQVAFVARRPELRATVHDCQQFN